MERLSSNDMMRLLFVRAGIFEAEASLLKARAEQNEFYKDIGKRYKISEGVSLNVDTGVITRQAANEVAAEAAKPVDGEVVQ